MDWFETLRNVAPTVATLIGGKAVGAVAETLINVVGKVLGVPPAEAQQALQRANPEQMAQIENDFVLAIQKIKLDNRRLDNEEYKTQTDDLNSARRLVLEAHDRTAEKLAYIAYGGFFGMVLLVVVLLAFGKFPTDPGLAAMIGGMISTFGMMATQAMAVYTGAVPPSSRQTPPRSL